MGMQRKTSIHRPFLALGLTLLLGALATPKSVEAQCSGCRFHLGSWVCGDPQSEEKCQGASGYECEGCENEYADVPFNLTPDGSLHRLATESDAEAWDLYHTSPGVRVLRSACSGFITDRYYTKEAAARVRRATAILTLS